MKAKQKPRGFRLTLASITLSMLMTGTHAYALQEANTDTQNNVHDFTYDQQKNWHIEAGDSQSPIDIRLRDVVPADQPSDENDAITMHTTGDGASVVDNGHTVQVIPENSSATIRGRHFALVQAHFHAPAEHTIDGKHYPVEGHFVFRAQDGRLAVVAVLYKEGAENEQFAAIIGAAKRHVTTPLASFNAAALLPASSKPYYHYLGSLTTPPLSENVEWYVLSRPVDLSSSDIAAFKRLYAHNARDQQPLNGRPLLNYAD